jgi:succinate-semialdehyde dehydrogenase/glutarate-semialdehyde dehydrogenase|tara:strand:- start:591 stop:1964 length:1374 start_codon:yes stop_codon:yes gene_type:complete
MSDLRSINPSNGDIVGVYPQLSAQELNQLILEVNSEFDFWRKIPIKDRCQYFKYLAEAIQMRKDEFARLMALEMGKPLSQGIVELEKCAWVCNYYADNGEKFLADQNIITDASESYVSFQPLGVILAIMPWNFPFWQVFRFVAPAMIAGNVAVLKHASNVQGCADAIEGLFIEVGIPNNTFRNLTIDSSKVDYVIENPFIKAVSLTGSTSAGKSVAQKAGSVLKKTVLELGGSDPYVVLKDADLDIAVDACISGRLLNSGQSCIAAKRYIVDINIQLEFEKKIINKIKKQKVGDPFLDKSTVGPMVNKAAKDELAIQVSKSIDEGAKLIYESDVPNSETGCYHPIMVLSNVKPGMPAFDEELFGPVACIITAQDQSEAISLANQTAYGLGAAVFTSDIEKGKEIAKVELEAGAGFVNDFVRSDPRLPFGGVKESGYGNELSSYGILEFVNIKTVYIR